jgi:hypothetical protein
MSDLITKTHNVYSFDFLQQKNYIFEVENKGDYNNNNHVKAKS